jgi:dTDP-glucose 4,6-dehydratase
MTASGKGPLLVTGGAGFIGSCFTKLALKQGYEVVVLDLLTYAGHESTLADVRENAALSFIQGDISNGALVRDLILKHRPRALVHFAAETHVDRSIDDPSGFLRTNVMGTFTLMEAFRTLPGLSEDRRFILISTDEVFGALGPTGAFSETSPYAPNSPYSASKAGADLLARAYHETYRFPVIVTHCSNNYGPYQFPEKLIPLMILNASEAKDLPVYGDGLQVRDWIHVEDHSAGVLAALEKGEPGAKYFFGARAEKTNRQVLDALLAALERFRPAAENAALKKRGIPTYQGLIRSVKDRPGHDRRYAIDPSKTEKALGWTPRHSFEESVAETVRWYLDHLDWCALVQKNTYGRERLGLTGHAGSEARA